MTVGIDASNLSYGGGKTHLIELLKAALTREFGIERIVVWGNDSNLPEIPDHTLVVKRNIPELNRGLLQRLIWVTFQLGSFAEKEGVDILLVPGGIHTGGFKPAVTMCQNLLPFEWAQARRYGFSWMYVRLKLLRHVLGHSFKRSDGVIFLTENSRVRVQKELALTFGLSTVVPHGVSKSFMHVPRIQSDIKEYSPERPFRLLYVSTVDAYKNHSLVMETVARLRVQTGWPLAIDFVGGSAQGALKEFTRILYRLDPKREWAIYHGFRTESAVKDFFSKADMCLFASGCENLPITLLMKMASGLPIISSNAGPMPEILRDSAVLFSPSVKDSLFTQLKGFIESPETRFELAMKSNRLAQRYDWQACASSTFEFLREVHQKSLSSREREYRGKVKR